MGNENNNKINNKFISSIWLSQSRIRVEQRKKEKKKQKKV